MLLISVRLVEGMNGCWTDLQGNRSEKFACSRKKQTRAADPSGSPVTIGSLIVPNAILRAIESEPACFCFLNNLSGLRILTTLYPAKTDHQWFHFIQSLTFQNSEAECTYLPRTAFETFSSAEKGNPLVGAAPGRGALRGRRDGGSAGARRAGGREVPDKDTSE